MNAGMVSRSEVTIAHATTQLNFLRIQLLTTWTKLHAVREDSNSARNDLIDDDDCGVCAGRGLRECGGGGGGAGLGLRECIAQHSSAGTRSARTHMPS